MRPLRSSLDKFVRATKHVKTPSRPGYELVFFESNGGRQFLRLLTIPAHRGVVLHRAWSGGLSHGCNVMGLLMQARHMTPRCHCGDCSRFTLAEHHQDKAERNKMKGERIRVSCVCKLDGGWLRSC